VDEGLTIYGIRRVQPAASERARRYGDMPGKQKRLTGQHVFFKEKCVLEKSVRGIPALNYPLNLSTLK
jgi:hypothetical protein